MLFILECVYLYVTKGILWSIFRFGKHSLPLNMNAHVHKQYILKRVNCVNREIRPNRPNGPVGGSRTSTSTCPTKVGPILSHGPPVGTKAQTCPSRFKKLVLQAREACSASLRGLFSKSGWLPQQVCEACSARKGGKTSLL